MNNKANFLTIAKNAKLRVHEVKYQSGMLPSPRDWIYLSHSQNNVIEKISMNLCNFIKEFMIGFPMILRGEIVPPLSPQPF